MVSFDFPTDGGTGASTTLVPWRKHYTLHSDNDLACSKLFISVGKLSKPRGNARVADRKGGTRKELLSGLFEWSHFRISCADYVHESQTCTCICRWKKACYYRLKINDPSLTLSHVQYTLVTRVLFRKSPSFYFIWLLPRPQVTQALS